MVRIRRQGLSSKLFSLIGGVASGLVITMAVVIPMPGRQMPVLTARAEQPLLSKTVRTKAPSIEAAAFEVVEEGQALPYPQDQPVIIPQLPVATLQIETSLPDQTDRNLALQYQTRQIEPNRVTHQLAQAWEPGMAYSPRYLPHTNQGGNPRRPDPGQPGITGRDGRNPKPPEGPEPASYGN